MALYWYHLLRIFSTLELIPSFSRLGIAQVRLALLIGHNENVSLFCRTLSCATTFKYPAKIRIYIGIPTIRYYFFDNLNIVLINSYAISVPKTR